MEKVEKEFALEIFDFAAAKSDLFWSILFSEIFGLFAVLAILGISNIQPEGKTILVLVYVKQPVQT